MRSREHALHRQFADALRLELAPAGQLSVDSVLWFGVDHANFAGAATGARMARGIVSGPSDLMLVHHGQLHGIEVKGPGGRLSASQQDFAAALEQAGGRYAVVQTLEGLLHQLDCWSIPRARRLRLYRLSEE
jgi:hypothetical protein